MLSHLDTPRPSRYGQTILFISHTLPTPPGHTLPGQGYPGPRRPRTQFSLLSVSANLKQSFKLCFQPSREHLVLLRFQNARRDCILKVVFQLLNFPVFAAHQPFLPLPYCYMKLLFIHCSTWDSPVPMGLKVQFSLLSASAKLEQNFNYLRITHENLD